MVRGWDHPREYGENKLSFSTLIWSPGSSPRIRGEFLAGKMHRSPTGIIPANTGRIRQWNFNRRVFRDHPREYGENVLVSYDQNENGGSSPRIRGEL